MQGLPINTMDKPVIEFMSAKKNRQFLTGENYLSFIKRMMEKDRADEITGVQGLPMTTEQFRSAGFYMMNSLYSLLCGDKAEAYRYFELYKSMTPEAIQR
jgi:hypothetical protein